MYCGECGAQNREGRKFCTRCGSPLDAACTNCGALLDPGDTFCGDCGTPVAVPASAPAATSATPQPAAERRLVSVVFADLVGFTTYSENRDPEDVRNMLGRYFDRAREIAELYGGVVEKFIGDAVMAVWGTPVAREDDAERSVRAALELVEAVTALGNELGAELQARAGVFTGEAAVTLGAEAQGMVAGNMVNTASRLQSVADPGTVLVDRTTYLATRSAIAYESAGTLQLKGKDEVVEAWRGLRVTAGVGGFRSDDALEPPFTGRLEELRLVKDLLHASERESRPRLASIIGIAGIGKSRLIWEFFKYIDGLKDLIFWHQGRSPAYGDGVAFWALAEMVRMRARIAETDTPEEATAKLEACLDEYVRDPDERVWLEPHLAYLIGLEASADEEREQRFAAWRTFFERVAEKGPVVMVFEDLHWADPGLIDFVEHMMSWARNSPILLLTLARPELMDRRPNWGAGQRSFISVHLEPLSTEDMTLLLKGLVDDLPEDIRNEIVERAEGVPLYAVEMVRMLHDRSSLVPVDGGFRWVGGMEQIEIPETLHSLIASRLDSLPGEDRLLVQDAAVLGKTFTLDSLRAVTSIEAVEERLADLARREIFVVDLDPRSPERGQYGFVQSLIKEIAYQTLSNADRRDRHLKAAAYFESTGEPDLIDVVANHYLEAHENSQGEAALEIAGKARTALIEAAERSKSLGSSGQALVLFDKAIEVTTDESDKAHVLYRAGDAALSAGRVDVSIERLKAAIEAMHDSTDRAALGLAQARLGQAYFFASALDEAIEMLEAAAQKIVDPLRDPSAASIYAELARIHTFAGNVERATDYSIKAMPPAEMKGAVREIADALITRGVLAIMGLRFHEADALLFGGLKLAQEAELIETQIRALINISANQLLIHPKLSKETATQGLHLARRYGKSDGAAFLLSNLMDAALHLGEWDLIRDATSEAIDHYLTDTTLYIVQPGLIQAHAFFGELDEARKHLVEFGAAIDPSTSVQDAGALALSEAALALVEGRFAEVSNVIMSEDYEKWRDPQQASYLGHAAVWAGDVDMLRSALDLLDGFTIQNEWIQARRLTLQAGLAALGGELEEAGSLFDEALARWNDIQIPLDEALAQMDAAICLGAGRSAEAAKSAIAFFTDAGNDAFVARFKERVGL